jgi:long-chain acyl-CoA synthetase
LKVLEGYGLTETSAASVVNPPGAARIGTVGRPIPGSTVAIADDGEVLLKGHHVFRGYWRNERATAEALDPDGWFRSGDIGSLDEDGYLRITGRKKELIVTAGGKNVAPAVLEDRLRAHPLISQVMVVGDDRPYIAALVTIDAEEYPKWAARQGIDLPSPRRPSIPLSSPPSRKRSTKPTRRCRRPSRSGDSASWPADFSIEGGELTPTLKVRRGIVADIHADEIEALYA